MYDAIVIGARCAGSPTAMLLARRGLRVLLVDKARFPSDTVSTHYLQQPGVAALKRWGLRGPVAATGAPPVTQVTFDAGDGFRLTGAPPAVEGAAEAYCVRRRYLDKVLVDAALEAGVEFREDFSVEEIVSNGQRVTGIRGRQSDGGDVVSEHARLVIGADGVRSIVARSMLAQETRYVPPLTCNYYTYFSGVELEGVEAYPRAGCFLVACPTNDGLTQLTVVWPHHEFARRRQDVEANLFAAVDEHAPSLAARLRAGRREERISGTPLLPNYIRKPWGNGWALVGDAGCMKDPITAQGMSDAFRDAELLAGAVSAGFYGRCPMDQALAWYQRQRDAAIGHMFQHTCEMAHLAPVPPQVRDLLAAIRHKPDEVTRFLGTMSGATSIPEFYSPENLARLLADEPVAV